jgi:hypothetical protein
MVGHTRGTATTRRIRRLKTPQAFVVESDRDGAPLRVRLNGAWLDVTPLQRPWRVDQYWWRGEPVRRDYCRVVTENGPPLTLYRDLITDQWFRQEYR